MATATLATIGGVQFIVGNPGDLASDPNNARIDSRTNENATAIDLGDVVAQGAVSTPGQVGNCKPFVTSAVPIGIAVRQLSEANAASGNTVNYPQFKTVAVLKDGDIWATALETVVERDTVIAVNGSSGIGSLTGGAANGTTRVLVPGAVWMSSVVAGQVGMVRIKTV